MKASYEAKKPCLPVNIYPSSHPSHVCSLKYESITRPSGDKYSSSFFLFKYHTLDVVSNRCDNLLLIVSSGPKALKLFGFSLMISRINSPRTRISSFSMHPGCVTSTLYFSILGTFNSFSNFPPLAYGLAPILLYGTIDLIYGLIFPFSSNNSSG